MKYGRHEDGVKEAFELMRHCRDTRVIYWYLDNEPWNQGITNYTFKGNEYATECALYGEAIKKEFPNAKLIANPTTENADAGVIKSFLQIAGKFVDYIDVHWYWGWGTSSFDRWLDEPPSYSAAINRIQTTCRDSGFPKMGVVVLEWNVVPSDWNVSFSPSSNAVIQGNLLLEFLNHGAELTCRWPLLWRTSRDAWPEQDVFQSVVSSLPPYGRTLSVEMFRMFSAVRGRKLVACESSAQNNLVSAAVDDPKAGTTTVFLVSRSPLRRRMTVEFEKATTGTGRLESISVKDNKLLTQDGLLVRDGKMECFIEPYSLNALTVRLAR